MVETKPRIPRLQTANEKPAFWGSSHLRCRYISRYDIFAGREFRVSKRSVSRRKPFVKMREFCRREEDPPMCRGIVAPSRLFLCAFCWSESRSGNNGHQWPFYSDYDGPSSGSDSRSRCGSQAWSRPFRKQGISLASPPPQINLSPTAHDELPCIPRSAHVAFLPCKSWTPCSCTDRDSRQVHPPS